MAVYTEIDDDDLVKFISDYDIGEVLSCHGIAEGIENSNYALTTTMAPFILTLFEKRIKPEDLPFFLSLLDHLASRGMPCPMPVRDKGGMVLRQLAGKPAAIVCFLDGKGLKDITDGHCRELGHALARLHTAAADFDGGRPNDLSVESWSDQLAKCQGRADEVEPGLEAFLNSELMYITSHWPQDLPKGIIHADLFPDNVFFSNNRLSGLIDFYFACSDFYAYDIAICLNAWCFEADHSFNEDKARCLLSSYQAHRELTAEEIRAFPILLRGAAMRFALTRLYDWLYTPPDALVSRKDPMEYVNILKFHTTVKDPQIYGLEKSK